MSHPSPDKAISPQTPDTNTNKTFTDEDPVASPTNIDSHNPDPGDAMFGRPGGIGSTSTMGSMGSGCGCSLFDTLSEVSSRTCAAHTQGSVVSAVESVSGRQEENLEEVGQTTTPNLFVKGAEGVDGSDIEPTDSATATVKASAKAERSKEADTDAVPSSAEEAATTSQRSTLSST